jgi:putative oxidoreductase
MNVVVDDRARAVTHNLLRIATGLFFWQHGAQKLFGWLGGQEVETLASWTGVAGILEFFGGPLIALGLFTRPVAFILAGEMAVAYFRVHAPQGFWPIMNRGELAALFCFVFLYFATHGAGSVSLDRLLSRRSRPPRSE